MKSLTSFDRQLAADFRAVLQEEREARGIPLRKPAPRRPKPAPEVHTITFSVDPRVTHKASGIAMETGSTTAAVLRDWLENYVEAEEAAHFVRVRIGEDLPVDSYRDLEGQARAAGVAPAALATAFLRQGIRDQRETA